MHNPLLAALALALSAPAASAAVVYDFEGPPLTTTTVVAAGDTSSADFLEIGDFVFLGGDPADRKLNAVTIFYQNMAAVGAPAADALVDVTYRFYGTDADDVLVDVPFYQFTTNDRVLTGAVAGSNVLSELTTAFPAATAPVLPDNLLLTLAFNDRKDAPAAPGDGLQGVVGLVIANPPAAVGSTDADFVLRNNAGNLSNAFFAGGQNPLFIIDAVAVPEPAAGLALAGVAAALLVRRRRA